MSDPVLAVDDFGYQCAEKAVSNMATHGYQNYKTLVAVLAEEAGEIARAVIEHEYAQGDEARIFEEAIDCGAVCLQIMALVHERTGQDRA